jgi:hypothetical protein
VLATLDADGDSVVPIGDLPPGVVFWRAFARTGGTVDAEPSATWELFVRRRSAPVSTSWGTTLDVDGDGHPDLAVGSPRGADTAGPVSVYAGGPSGIDASAVVTLAVPSGEAGDFGRSLASAGDVNGDGFADLAVGAPGDAGARVYVYLGSASGAALVPSIVIAAPSPDESAFGTVVAGAGDVNGDGFADLAVSGGSDRSYVFFGRAVGTSAEPDVVVRAPADATLTGGLSGGTDVNGDGHTDLVASGTTGAGAPCAYVFLGTSAGLPDLPDATLSAPTGPRAVVASAADVNGDGYADVAVGGDAAAYVFLGSAAGTTSMPAATLPTVGTALVASASDTNGDGYDDLVVGDPPRGATLYYGGALGLDTASPGLYTDADPGAHYGAAVAGAGDVDGNGYAELVIGAPGSAEGAGRVFVLVGNESGPAMPRAAVLVPQGIAGAFGAALAGTAP